MENGFQLGHQFVFAGGATLDTRVPPIRMNFTASTSTSFPTKTATPAAVTTDQSKQACTVPVSVVAAKTHVRVTLAARPHTTTN